MDKRNERSTKKYQIYMADINTIIERLKKVRALNCNPSDVGINDCSIRKFNFDRLNKRVRYI